MGAHSDLPLRLSPVRVSVEAAEALRALGVAGHAAAVLGAMQVVLATDTHVGVEVAVVVAGR